MTLRRSFYLILKESCYAWHSRWIVACSGSVLHPSSTGERACSVVFRPFAPASINWWTAISNALSFDAPLREKVKRDFELSCTLRYWLPSVETVSSLPVIPVEALWSSRSTLLRGHLLLRPSWRNPSLSSSCEHYFCFPRGSDFSSFETYIHPLFIL